MIKREEDNNKNDGIGLKQLSNDAVYMFYTEEKVSNIVKMFYDIAMNPEEKTADRLKAGEQILDRVLGKPKQTIDGNIKTNMGVVDRDILVKALKDYDVTEITNGDPTTVN